MLSQGPLLVQPCRVTDDPLLPPAAAAARVGIGLKLLRRLGLPYEGKSTRKHYRASVLDAWLAENGTTKQRQAARASQQFTTYRTYVKPDGATIAASVDPRFETWRGIVERTSDPHNPYYGGRGITMHEAWRDDPAAFYEWWDGNLPPYVKDKKHSLDRIDNNRGYEPGNLRYTTLDVQNANRRRWAEHPYGYPCLCTDGPHEDGSSECPERQLFTDLRDGMESWLDRALAEQTARSRQEWESMFGPLDVPSLLSRED
jgi:hypothetical protein